MSQPRLTFIAEGKRRRGRPLLATVIEEGLAELRKAFIGSDGDLDETVRRLARLAEAVQGLAG